MHRSIRSLAIPAVALALLTTACSDDEEPATTTAADTTIAPTTTEHSDHEEGEEHDDEYGEDYGDETSTTGGEATVVGIMEAVDQTGDGSVLVVDSVSLQGASGHIAIHIDVDGTPGAVVGHVAVPEGITEALEVPFDTPPAASGTYWPMLHVDNGDGEYEFPGPDGPLVVDDVPVMTPVVLTVE